MRFGFGRSFGNFFLLLDPFARHALTSKEKGWACFAAALYGLFLGIEIAGSAWTQVVVMSIVPGFFLGGAGIHPGGGVSGLPGRIAAQRVLRHLKKTR